MSRLDKYIRIYNNEKIVFSYNLEKVIAIPTSSRMPEEKIYFIEGVFLDKYKILLFSDRCEHMEGELRLFKDGNEIFNKYGPLKGHYTFEDLDIHINSVLSEKGEDIGTKIPLASVGFYAQYRYEEEEKDV